MNAIIIKVNEKVIGVSKIVEIPQKDFIELQKEIVKTWQDKDKQVIALENEVSRLGEYTKELEAKINYLGKQIAIDRGEIEEDSEEEYEVIVRKKQPTGQCYTEDGKLEDVYFDPNEEEMIEIPESEVTE